MLALPSRLTNPSRSRSTSAPSAIAIPVLLLLATFAAAGADPRSLSIDSIPLPPLQIAGQPAQAHTQGLEVIRGEFYVTARRDDGPVKAALLLRTKVGSATWDAWDITPLDSSGKPASFDHPGGMQSDGRRLWIPIAESRRQGRSVIRAFPLSGLIPGQTLKYELEIPVNDHIGAIAVDRHGKWVYGANWDTESVYVWDHSGTHKRTFTWAEMETRQLGRVKGAPGREGLRVQDWKAVGNQLFASGLLTEPTSSVELPESRFTCFDHFATSRAQRWSTVLPKDQGVELANEAMAVADRMVYLLPEDLGPSNRVFRVSLADLRKHRLRQPRQAR